LIELSRGEELRRGGRWVRRVLEISPRDMEGGRSRLYRKGSEGINRLGVRDIMTRPRRITFSGKGGGIETKKLRVEGKKDDHRRR